MNSYFLCFLICHSFTLQGKTGNDVRRMHELDKHHGILCFEKVFQRKDRLDLTSWYEIYIFIWPHSYSLTNIFNCTLITSLALSLICPHPKCEVWLPPSQSGY